MNRYSHEGTPVPPSSRIIESLLDPTPIPAPDLSPSERELLEKPVLGKGSHAEALFRRFADNIEIDPNPRKINRMKIRIMATDTTPPEIRAARHEGRDFILVFNDLLGGYNLALERTEQHGVFFALLEDRLEPHRENMGEFGDQTLEAPSLASITLSNDGRLFMVGVLHGELIESRIKDRAELGFSAIFNQLLWSPAHTNTII